MCVAEDMRGKAQTDYLQVSQSLHRPIDPQVPEREIRSSEQERETPQKRPDLEALEESLNR